ncbi:hypothetical protein C4559_04895 [Candidatus Microgenomates bacterium]|nr:MAG: hypothetical protein C4559_04895 [Candidatus Microgenomates bacterium]
MTKFLLDSGDPDEYKQICSLAQKNNSEIWGATTNPSLIAKKLAGQKISSQKAFELQKQIVLEILNIVPGAVSAEVYADENTKAQDMVKQGLEIAKWHERIVVKLPTNLEGFKARTELRKAKIITNNTLVFSQEQIFAICLHERIIQKTFGPIDDLWPSFISPFVGRLDDIGLDGMTLITNAMKMKEKYGFNLWMLEASVRTLDHLRLGIEAKTELITAPGKVYAEWFSKSTNQQINKSTNQQMLKPIKYWEHPQELINIETIEGFMKAIESGKLNIKHELTDKGLVRFASDWKAIIQEEHKPLVTNLNI